MRSALRMCAALVAAWGCGASAAADDQQPSPVAATAAAAHPLDPTEARCIRAILDQGFRGDPAGLKAAETEFNAAQREQTDPRINYAYAVVLLKKLKHQDAIKTLETAVAQETEPYLPAWQALIRTRLVLQQYPPALEAAQKLAQLVGDSTVAWPSEATRLEGARWLGRVVEACALAEIEPAEGPGPVDVDVAARRALEPELEAAYDEGIGAVTAEHQRLSELIDQARENAARREEEKRKQRATEIADSKKKAEQQAIVVKRDTKEWSAWLDDQLDRSAKELERLEKDYEALDTAATRVSLSSLDVQRQINVLQLSRRSSNLRRNDLLQYDLMIGQLEAQLSAHQLQLLDLGLKADQVTNQADAVLAGRAAAVREFEAATGKLAKKDDEVTKWTRRLEKSAEKNRQPAKVAGAAAQRKNLTKIATYLDLDPDQEKQRLLAEIGTNN